ncbi:glycosyltransferase [Stutzerimonas zhaodongensis]|uniref:glycosyltransferase n=1 Tax=Stutzerimonas zhaodongensis TaxID=1176257 RepID=UPI002105136A|nr:glycosyltransferase [Stutzerimonas zhaodongensis]MCQ2031178.1 glycosyltransferase [Stutzerimonas zhaodongensis]
MRIVIDMQGRQATNHNRGIGRYVESFALALVRNKGEHEVILALNGAFPESIEGIRAKFEKLIPQGNIRIWNAVVPMAHIDAANDWRRQAGEVVREVFLSSLNPDVVVVSSLFEGLFDDAVTSIKKLNNKFVTATLLYDLIPLIQPKPYLENPLIEAWYLEKIEYLRRADIWLGISESSKKEGLQYLGLPSERSFNISTGADEHFCRIPISAEVVRRLRDEYRLTRKFVMYTGGIDHRKNIEGLIRAYARLPSMLRKAHQLAIVCTVQEDSRRKILKLAKEQGLTLDELVLTGFVPEDHLIALYNLCAVFVFPSWHEGFGLPALEAMRCGAPVIAANTSSLPEVVGLADALFDPHSDEAISSAIQRVLTDATFREYLITHGREQATKFKWDETARRAIDAMELVITELNTDRLHTDSQLMRPKLAYLSPLPPQRSGISDYSAELLPALSQHYDIEVVVEQDSVTDSCFVANYPIRSIQWFAENARYFERVLYHFGNSAFHQHMFRLLKDIPGVVVMHDFFLSGVLHHMDAIGYTPGCFMEQLYNSHGYVGLLDRHKAKDIAEVIWKYPCSREVIEHSIGTIVHSENSVRLAQHWYGDESPDWSVIPLVRVSESTIRRAAARKELGFSDKELIVCSFGMLGPTKLSQRLLRLWLDSDLARSAGCHLVFVGANDPGEYGNELLKSIKIHPNGISVSITGWADKDKFRQYLAAADIGVQLRTLSRGETSAAVLDCMNYGLATIVNANGSMIDLPGDAVWKLPDEFDDQAFISALETLWRNPDRRKQIGARAKSLILEQHNPVRCAKQYKLAIERFYSSNPPLLSKLSKSIAAIPIKPVEDHEMLSLASSLATSFPRARAAKQLLVDISELVRHDSRTGIQRVVRSVLHNWLISPPAGWRVEPVYSTADEPYRYARQFTTGFLDLPGAGFEDDIIDFAPGDVFFALDLQPRVQATKADFYQHIRRQGVTVKFMVYDLLCVLQPDHFLPGADCSFIKWLRVVGESDGAVCISKSVADELSHWMAEGTWNRLRPFAIDWCHLGADFGSSVPTCGLFTDSEHVFSILNRRPSFLMVGTLEPRKGHSQVLDAFEQLWKSGADINLVIVGKLGWMVDSLEQRLRDHPELDKRLFWFNDVGDDQLERLYAASVGLIAASYGEGFGLPLIEAAQHKLPIIARDIPVFREVAGEYAYFFAASSGKELAVTIADWLRLYREGQHPASDGMQWLTWQESAAQLKHVLTVTSTHV